MRVWMMSLLVGCAASPTKPQITPPSVQGALETPPDAPTILEQGGELLPLEIEPGVHATSQFLEAFARLEVDADSRLQAALRMAEATARAELIKAVLVHVSSQSRHTASTHQEQHVEQIDREAVSAAFSSTQQLAVGWAKVQRGDEPVLIVAARLRAKRADVEAAVAQASATSVEALWQRLMEGAP